jgi:hypothetical protein
MTTPPLIQALGFGLAKIQYLNPNYAKQLLLKSIQG